MDLNIYKMLSLSENPDINYLAEIVEIENISKHPNADKLQLVRVCGADVVTGLTAKQGDYYCYFPIECQIDDHYLSWSNSFSDAEKNSDTTKKGYFPKNARVKAVKLRGVYSNGYIVPVQDLENFLKETAGVSVDLSKFANKGFDTLNGKRFVRKYVRHAQVQNPPSQKKKGNVKKYETKLVPGQFAFHEDTLNLRRNLGKIKPDDVILISEKIHGSSWIVAKVLVLKKLSFLEKLVRFFGFKIQDKEYGNLYSSRTVIKNRHIDLDPKLGFYDSDIWKIVSNKVYPLLDDGISLYGEVFGYTPTGGMIQPKYDYGCKPGELDFIVYKGTITLPDGRVYVMSYPQLKSYCDSKGLKMAETHYYGKAKDLYPDIDVHNHWADNFMQRLEKDFLEKKCKLCQNDVWAEGICISKEVPFKWDCLKLKSNEFLGYESAQLDSAEPSLEEIS